MFDYANGDGHELAGIRFESGSWSVTSWGGHVDRAFGKCLGAFYERVEDGKPVEEEDFGENVIIVA